MWPGFHIALSFSLSWKTNARKMIDFSEARKLFWCFAILFWLVARLAQHGTAGVFVPNVAYS